MRFARLAAVLFLVACTHVSSMSGRPAGAQPGVFRFADGEDIDNLNPLLSTETLVNDLSSFTMGYFFVFNQQGKPIPSLCLEVPTKRNGLISRDGKTITFKLRKGVLWQDGVPFTSADVAFTVGVILNPKTNVLTRDGWNDIARVDTPNKYTVVFHLKKPYAAFINRFFTPVGNPAILPKHLLEGKNINQSSYNELPVGLGPFRYVRWSRGNEVVMERFNRYWGGKAKLKRVVFKIIPDVNTVMTDLESHQLDAFVRVPTNLLAQARSIPGTRTIGYDTTSYGHIDFNLRKPPLANLLVRRALAHAIDVRLMWRKIDHRSGYLSCSPISHLSWAYDAHAHCYGFNLHRADQLLSEAGWRMGKDGRRHKDGKTLRLLFAGNTGNPGLDERVLLIQRWFKKIGVVLTYRRYPTNQLFASFAAGGIVATGKYDLTSYAWSLAPDPDLTNLIACSRIPPNGENYMGYCDPQVDQALADALLHYSRRRRRADYVFVQQRLARDVPFIVLSQRTDHITFRDGVHGLRPGPSEIFWNPTQISD
ncbi:MAG: peptide ABC transporter substrate-binding protein [Vulcanimicrobiaceae bacterium]